MSEAKRLSELINLLKTNQVRFSEKAGIAQGSVSAIISHKKRITRDILDAIAQAFTNVNIEWLLYGRGDPFEKNQKEPEGNLPIVSENPPVYSPKISADFPSEDQARKNMGHNLKAASERWKLNQREMLALLGADVGRQAVSTYYRGEVLPKFTVLLRFEQATGWPLLDLASRAMQPQDMPSSPLPFGTNSAGISAVEMHHLTEEMKQVLNTLAKILNKKGDFPPA